MEMPPDRGWLGLDGTPRFEGLSPLPPAGGFVAFRANDRLFGRTVRLVFGGEELLGKAWLAGRLEHPAAVTIHEAGLTPQGKAFAATTDVSAASPLGERGVRDTLRALAQAAEALAHAAGRGLARATILPDEILVFPDGSARLDGVLGWREAKDGDALAGVRSLQEILAQTLERTKSPDALLAALARHPYPTAAVLAADLRAWLEGRPLSVARDPVFRRLVRFSKKRPGLAAASLGTLVAAAGLSLFGASESRLAAGREAQAREIAASQDERRTDELLAEGVGLVSEVLSLDRERALVLARIEKRYHEVDAPHPAPDEVELASELSRLSAERDALARPARAALAGVLARRPGDGRASEGLRTLETGELEHLFTAAAFEEGKILSTRTLGLARETVSVQEALAAGDAAMARERAEALSPGHPYRIAAIELARALAEHPEWRDSLDRHIKALACHGRLVLASLQAEATASWCDVGKDELERWTLGPESSLRPGESLSLLVGEYLVRVRHRGNEFRFDCLVERGKTWTVEGKTVPDEVPEGFVWIPASPFYVGEIGSNRRRYRRCQEVKRPFFIGRTEVTWKEYLGWLRTVPREDWKDLVPVYTHPVLTSEVVGEDGEVIPWLRPLADDRFPVWGITQPAALRFCQEHCGSAGSSGDLPAEFEWELAARGIAGRAFSFGDRSFPGAANIERQSGGPIPWTVSDEPAEDKSIFGVSGMCGNVSEWTHTRFADEIVIAKGGSWSSEAGRACPSNRMAFFQNKQFPYAGFRAAMYSRGE